MSVTTPIFRSDVPAAVDADAPAPADDEAEASVDGDVAGVIHTADASTGIDIYLGIGGAPDDGQAPEQGQAKRALVHVSSSRIEGRPAGSHDGP